MGVDWVVGEVGDTRETKYIGMSARSGEKRAVRGFGS